jgi:anti-sigma B factor antagonist
LNPTPFQVNSTQEAGKAVIVVEGELDMNTAPLLERELEAVMAVPDAAVLLDLSGCEFIDSTGIALIVRAWQGLEGEDRFALCGVSDQVKRVLDITGLQATIPTHASREEALSRPQD